MEGAVDTVLGDAMEGAGALAAAVKGESEFVVSAEMCHAVYAHLLWQQSPLQPAVLAEKPC